MTDGSGTLSNTITYDGFGKVTNETNSATGDRYKFAGRELDSESGLQFQLSSGHPRSCLRRYPPSMVSPVPCPGGTVHVARSTTRFPQGTILARGVAPLA
jgi:hypothetical protein